MTPVDNHSMSRHGRLVGISLPGAHTGLYTLEETMRAVKARGCEFREQIARISNPIRPWRLHARAKRWVSMFRRPQGIKPADLGEIKAAAIRLAATLASMSEKEVGAGFKEWPGAKAVEMIMLRCQHPDFQILGCRIPVSPWDLSSFFTMK